MMATKAMESPEIVEAKQAVSQYVQDGRGSEATIELYNQHGAKYDEYNAALNYKGPATTAAAAARCLGDDFGARILDVGAGTGEVGVNLANLGYKNIDAVDPAEGLLEVAKSKGIYKNIFKQFVGLGKHLPIEDDTYDAVVMSGVITDNHVPKEAFHDIIRVVKPGGYVVNVFREMAMRASWYGEGLEPFLKQLEKDGFWKEITRTRFPNFLDGIEGLELVHQVL